jgi:hypothetical protein
MAPGRRQTKEIVNERSNPELQAPNTRKCLLFGVWILVFCPETGG